MAWLEIIHILSHSHPDRDNIIKSFRQLDNGKWPDKLSDISLFTSHAWEGDVGIIMQWRGKPTKESKSPLGLQLARAFSQFGQIHHSVWFRDIRLKIGNKEKT